jgi:uncharacterized Ntn-hydrolase superfamily protein
MLPTAPFDRRAARALAPALLCAWLAPAHLFAEPPRPSTFSIAAVDVEAGEVGVAVASRFFAVGSVVPFAAANAGAVATQSSANTSFGPRGLDLLRAGLTAEEALRVLVRADDGRDHRQVGLVDMRGGSATHTGTACTAWAGGRTGPGYAAQGNILAGEAVVAAMEKSFLASGGQPLARRLFDALKAGDAAGGDSRGRQSAALLLARAGGGYNGFLDNAIDIRVDDHVEPFGELQRLLGIAMVNDGWNRGWTAFRAKRFPEALRWQEQTAALAESQPAILPEVLYDLAVIRWANRDREAALAALSRATSLNPKLAEQAKKDQDLAGLRD